MNKSDMEQVALEKYVIKRDDGKFLWKGNISYITGWKKGMENAWLFGTYEGATRAAYKHANRGHDCKVIRVGVRIDTTGPVYEVHPVYADMR